MGFRGGGDDEQRSGAPLSAGTPRSGRQRGGGGFRGAAGPLRRVADPACRVPLSGRDACRGRGDFSTIAVPMQCCGAVVNKAFVKESDQEDDEPELPAGLPAGTKHYMTRRGFQQLKAELDDLVKVARPTVVDPSEQENVEQVFFGATVTLCDADGGDERTYQIVGVDEADASAGRISWISPLAKALLKAHEGDVVRFMSPAGLRQIEVLEIRYL